jgi:alkylation response protein AidB-like acyl-CoA dehydrogenase
MSLEHARLELGAAEKVLSDAAAFVRTQRPAVPLGVDIQRASDDPHVILRFGQFLARLHAAQGLLARAARLAQSQGTHAAVAVIETRAFTNDLVNEIASQLIAWGSPAFPGERHAGGRSTEVANHWNYHHVGNYHLKGVLPK